ncbi:hypothetical protein AB205_0206830 [Aquarana catesbeiana]|uniref:Uncharacterized protein n=1 Tax=Aquarana catesbeiana TaxID=8400 RepID=A0A2G9PUM4_AQUCT|nr:hypothetical protein AB205_0206830 [Aquarana catesbeiana]
MAETQQVRANYSNEEEGEESPEPEKSRSRRRRFKASNMSFAEMLDILKRADYDGKPRSWRKWSRVCIGISGYDDRKISSGSGGRT